MIRQTLDPELEGLLHEISQDPRSTLLRVPRGITGRLALEPDAAVGAYAAGLTVTERHLLQVYRSEVAQYCRRAFTDMLLNRPHAGCLFSEYGPDNVSVRRSELRGRLVSVRAQALGSAQSGAREGTPASYSLAQLAATGLRLEPSDSSRIHLAIAEIVGGKLAAARQILTSVLRSPAALDVKACAWGNLALIHSMRGDNVSGYRAARKGLEACESWGTLSRTTFVYAIKSGDTNAFKWAAARLEDAMDPEDDVLSEGTSLSPYRRMEGWRGLSARSLEILQSMRPTLGPTSARLADALTV